MANKKIFINGGYLRDLQKERDYKGDPDLEISGVITVAREGEMNVPGWQALIHGESSVVYRPRNPEQGATLWIETEAAVTVMQGSYGVIDIP